MVNKRFQALEGFDIVAALSDLCELFFVPLIRSFVILYRLFFGLDSALVICRSGMLSQLGPVLLLVHADFGLELLDDRPFV